MQKQCYTKDVEMVTDVIGMYGHSIACTEGDDWKRHRKETQRAFNEVRFLFKSAELQSKLTVDRKTFVWFGQKPRLS